MVFHTLHHSYRGSLAFQTPSPSHLGRFTTLPQWRGEVAASWRHLAGLQPSSEHSRKNGAPYLWRVKRSEQRTSQSALWDAPYSVSSASLSMLHVPHPKSATFASYTSKKTIPGPHQWKASETRGANVPVMFLPSPPQCLEGRSMFAGSVSSGWMWAGRTLLAAWELPRAYAQQANCWEPNCGERDIYRSSIHNSLKHRGNNL